MCHERFEFGFGKRFKGRDPKFVCQCIDSSVDEEVSCGLVVVLVVLVID